MNELNPQVAAWLAEVLGDGFTADKHLHAHQDEVYRIRTDTAAYYLKLSKTLRAEHDNLIRLKTVLTVPEVIDYHESSTGDYLLISELPGKNLVELIGDWADEAIVRQFAAAVRQLHDIDARKVFPDATARDVLIHGDMALPNIIISEQQVGYIDFGQLAFGASMSELDLADAIWSLQRNLGPGYGELFLQEYGPLTMTTKIQQALDFRYQPPAAHA